jgi:hypothetical protein
MTEEESRPPRLTDALLARTKGFVVDLLAEWIKLPIAEVGRWVRRRVTFYAVGITLLIIALIFLLVGGVRGLQAISWMPYWAPYLGLGALAAGTGIYFLSKK